MVHAMFFFLYILAIQSINRQKMFIFEMFNLHKSCDERKPNFGISKNKNTYHLCSNSTADPPNPSPP